ncbi:GNAT family N-acetyltransferase [Halobacillus naozhouensis]|uniref:GNAT family protein n=1 Tax=Halobacillus naozhouensis TaxID=554880 RepID=A0ABY8J293_9BACI|nr:GNAT family protein [Halobacillus naozhouensis]WFT76618.1 GNAT family protein [Halobacillus naozhouensis]
MEHASDRIRFIPITVKAGQLMIRNPVSFYATYGFPRNKSWPHDGLKAILPFYVELLENERSELGFGPWMMVDRRVGEILGDIGFKGQPKYGMVEIGYYVVLSKRNQGFATEAVKAMCNWAFQQSHVRTVEAQCDKRNLASQQVLFNNGFNPISEKGAIITFMKEKYSRAEKPGSTQDQHQ